MQSLRQETYLPATHGEHRVVQVLVEVLRVQEQKGSHRFLEQEDLP